jgi:hypothetical protein
MPLGPVLPTPKPGECDALRAEIQGLDMQIAELDDAVNDRDANQLRAELARAQERRARAQARTEVLSCP